MNLTMSSLIRTFRVMAKCLPFVQRPLRKRRLPPVFLSPLSLLPLLQTQGSACAWWVPLPFAASSGCTALSSLVRLENSRFSFKTQLRCRLFCEFFLSTPRRLAFPSRRPPYHFVLHTKCQRACLPLPHMVSSKEQECCCISHT